MEPNQPRPEQVPQAPPPERQPDQGQPEMAPPPERPSQGGDSANQGDAAFASLPLPPPVPPAPAPAPSLASPTISGPAIADDVDLIEKEWVDKAKSIVNEHKHDPFNQEKEVSHLKADYQQKRYGKQIKSAE